ncbi:putative disease resistance protein At4g19050 isoform X2 [Macadamia integrifolia]|uniref:putative disease resistance protein At4g19050 isoform X1 n=1 Tax=Macadamia integrifolia TaxID=60698 RepID=UPI001C53304C|nr:putative disease resistance protein At4g19050 isoform X1 [Macadamia integrifolia]XP_042476993.1 putative disease resistance protein At4g19050 isoform X2 [Macadamia integrifolia]
MNECLSLMHLPTSFGELSSLKTLHIRNARIDQLPETLGLLEALTELYVDFSAIRLPISIRHLRNLQILSTDYYSMRSEGFIRDERQSKPRMGSEMDLLELPPSLKYLDASHCKMKSLPMLSNLTNLELLQLFDCPNLMEIPTTINALTRLESLYLVQCPHVQCIPHLPSSLKFLIVHNCENLREISGYSDVGNLEKLLLRDCSKLAKLSLEGLDSLQQFQILGCDSLRKLPKLRGLKKLRCLELRRVGFSEIEVLEGLYSLEKLGIMNCELLRIIPNLSDSKNLEWIEIRECNELSEIEGLKGLDSLGKLSISNCPSLRKIQLPKKLCELDILKCDKLSEIEIEGPEDLESLTIFHLCWCESIVRLPGLSNLKMLKDLWFFNLPLEINCFDGLESLEELCLFGSKSLKVLPDISPLKNLKHLSLSDCERI